MKKISFQSVLISMIAAVFAGVLLVGINAAMSEVPTVNPPGEGVHPTFTGVDVGSEGVKVDGTISMLDPASGDSVGSIYSSTLGGFPFVYADGNWVFNNNAAVVGGLAVQSDLNVSGELDVLGEVTFHDAITTVAPLQVGAGNWLTVDRITSADPGNLRPILINTPLQGIGDILEIDGDVDIRGGDLTMDGRLEGVNEIAPGPAVHSTAADPLTLETYNNNSPIVLDSDLGGVDIYGDVTMYDHLSAESFGGYYVSRSGLLSTPANSSYYVANGNSTHKQYCPAGYKVLSCHAESQYKAGWLQYYAGLMSYPSTDGSYCNGDMFNTKNSSLGFYVSAICFDPSG